MYSVFDIFRRHVHDSYCTKERQEVLKEYLPFAVVVCELMPASPLHHIHEPHHLMMDRSPPVPALPHILHYDAVLD